MEKTSYRKLLICACKDVISRERRWGVISQTLSYQRRRPQESRPVGELWKIQVVWNGELWIAPIDWTQMISKVVIQSALDFFNVKETALWTFWMVGKERWKGQSFRSAVIWESVVKNCVVVGMEENKLWGAEGLGKVCVMAEPYWSWWKSWCITHKMWR